MKMKNPINKNPILVKIINKILILAGADRHLVPSIYGRSSRKQFDIREDIDFKELAEKAMKDGKTLLYYDRLHTIYQALTQASKYVDSRSSFNTIEVGVYKGGGSMFISECLQKMNVNKKHFAVDTFEGHSAEDLKLSSDGWHSTGTFQETSFENVKNYLSKYNFVDVRKGRVQDVYNEILNDAGEIHFAHLDVDIEEPTIFMLDKFNKDMPAGGVVVIDDYGFRSCPGMRIAVSKLINNRKTFTGFELLTGQAILIKN